MLNCLLGRCGRRYAIDCIPSVAVNRPGACCRPKVMADAVKLNFCFWLPTTLPSTAAGATCTALPPTPPNSLSKAVGAREVAWQGCLRQKNFYWIGGIDSRFISTRIPGRSSYAWSPVKAFAHRARKFLCTSASPCGRSSRCGCIPALLCLAPFRSGP